MTDNTEGDFKMTDNKTSDFIPKTIQISGSVNNRTPYELFALQDNGMIWGMRWDVDKECYAWKLLPKIPKAWV